MSALIKKEWHLLQYLAHCTQKERKALIPALNREQIKAICECVLNLLENRIPLQEKDLKKLRRYKEVLRSLNCRKTKFKAKKALLNQKGGFLPFLLAPIVSVLGSIVGKAIAES